MRILRAIFRRTNGRPGASKADERHLTGEEDPFKELAIKYFTKNWRRIRMGGKRSTKPTEAEVVEAIKIDISGRIEKEGEEKLISHALENIVVYKGTTEAEAGKDSLIKMAQRDPAGAVNSLYDKRSTLLDGTWAGRVEGMSKDGGLYSHLRLLGAQAIIMEMINCRIQDEEPEKLMSEVYQTVQHPLGFCSPDNYEILDNDLLMIMHVAIKQQTCNQLLGLSGEVMKKYNSRYKEMQSKLGIEKQSTSGISRIASKATASPYGYTEDDREYGSLGSSGEFKENCKNYKYHELYPFTSFECTDTTVGTCRKRKEPNQVCGSPAPRRAYPLEGEDSFRKGVEEAAEKNSAGRTGTARPNGGTRPPARVNTSVTPLYKNPQSDSGTSPMAPIECEESESDPRPC